jgi:LppP/LprE lipoprotein
MRPVSAHAHRVPPRRHGFQLWFMRVIGLAATAVLLAAGVYALEQVLPKDDDTAAAVQAPPAAHKKQKHKASAKGRHAKAKPKYTAAQRHQRAAAVSALSDEGYRPVHLADYDARHVLRVMVGRGEAGQRAFFFTGSQYIGNDASEDSRSIRVARAGNRSVSLSYALHGGKHARVLFRWDGKKLAPQTAIPPIGERG